MGLMHVSWNEGHAMGRCWLEHFLVWGTALARLGFWGFNPASSWYWEVAHSWKHCATTSSSAAHEGSQLSVNVSACRSSKQVRTASTPFTVPVATHPAKAKAARVMLESKAWALKKNIPKASFCNPSVELAGSCFNYRLITEEISCRNFRERCGSFEQTCV